MTSRDGVKHVISVIMPVLNESAALPSTAARLRDLQPDHELIIVDGGSHDGTRQIAEQIGTLVDAPRGRGAQMNRGAETASGDVLVFLHADVWLEADALDSVARAVHSGYVAGTFSQRIDGTRPLYRWIERVGDFRARRLGVLYGDAGVFVTRRAFEQAGRFPEVAIGEELSFSRAVRRVGPTTLLPSRIHISPRRWEANGIVSGRPCAIGPSRLSLCLACAETGWHGSTLPFADGRPQG